jgi:hypothetical protein
VRIRPFLTWILSPHCDLGAGGVRHGALT